jgi:hypothetical protein
MYKIIIDPITKKEICIERISDHAFIPMDQNNMDYQDYLAWIAEGNTPLQPDGVQ